MATLSITATSVVPVGVTEKIITFGEAVTAGQPLYLKASDGRHWKAQADGTLAEATVDCIALSGGSAGQRGVGATGGTVTIGATTVAGTDYYLHGTAGLIGVIGDLSTTNYVHCLGQATTSGIINFSFRNTGVVLGT